MKRFIIVALLMLLTALITTVVVWYVLVGKLQTQNDMFLPENSAPTVPENSPQEIQVAEEEPTAQNEEEGGIYLRDLPLTPSQRSMLETAGIDVETFVITEAMIACAKEKLGEARFNEIIAGAAPSFLEGTSLLSCIR